MKTGITRNINNRSFRIAAAFICAVFCAATLISASAADSGSTYFTPEQPEFSLIENASEGKGTAFPGTEIKVSSASELERSDPALAGASNDVLMLSGEGGAGAEMDYTKYRFSCYGIRSITVRAFVPDTVRAMSLSVDGGKTSIGRYSFAGYERGRWGEFAFYDEGINFVTGYDMPDLANENGQLGIFSINFTGNVKAQDSGESESPEAVKVYIDYIEIKLKDASGKPELTYEGKDDIDQTAEKRLYLGSFKAYDYVEDRELPVTMRWEGSKGIDDNGKTIEGGPYTLILEAENSFGEKAEKRITVNVRPRDNEPPVIHINTDTVYVRPGVFGTMNVPATDNEDDVSVICKWSKNAVDEFGRLLPGEHELTLSSTDDTGNNTIRSVKVIVSDEADHDPESLTVIRDESKIEFEMPVWARILIIAAAAAVIIAAAVLIILKKKKNAVKTQED